MTEAQIVQVLIAQHSELVARVAKLESAVEHVHAAVGALVMAINSAGDDEDEITFTPDFHS